MVRIAFFPVQRRDQNQQTSPPPSSLLQVPPFKLLQGDLPAWTAGIRNPDLTARLIQMHIHTRLDAARDHVEVVYVHRLSVKIIKFQLSRSVANRGMLPEEGCF